ncbi:hypothetical protein K1W54_05690 [Micromonospora sp. CPCC 205371]|nr:hypothetical protein [Micromonospora sp. CPCC 205371]
MTQPPYGGANQQPEGQPGYPPPVDPYAAPPAQSPPPPTSPPPPPPNYGPYQPQYGQPQYGQPTSSPPYPAQPTSGQPYAPTSGSPYAPQPTSGQPYPPQPVSGQPYPPQPYPPQPVSAQPYPPQPVSGYPAYPGGPVPGPPKKRTGLVIAAVVAAVAVVLCGGGITGAVLLLRNTEPNPGQAEPVAAVQEFLKAVYNDQDPAKANDLVCAESRDEAEMKKKVDEVKNLATKYQSPRYKWDEPKIDNQDSESAKVSVKVTMTTSDEKIAEQQLTFTVVQKTGWFVCEIAS